jgi:hypothetical protein
MSFTKENIGWIGVVCRLMFNGKQREPAMSAIGRGARK